MLTTLGQLIVPSFHLLEFFLTAIYRPTELCYKCIDSIYLR